MTQPVPDPEEQTPSELRSSLAINELIAANEASNRTMTDLVDTVRSETKARDRKVDALDKNLHQMRLVTFLVAVTMVVLLALAVTNAFNLSAARKSAKQTKDIAAAVQTTNQTLLDCVNSTGVCGQVNSANQSKILDTVKQYELTVIYCARTNPANLDPKGDKFLVCVNKLYPGGPQLNRQNQ